MIQAADNITTSTGNECMKYPQVGPHAVNLAGGQAASIRIFKDIMVQHSGLDESTSERMEKTRTEEYISHMHGLMWL